MTHKPALHPIELKSLADQVGVCMVNESTLTPIWFLNRTRGKINSELPYQSRGNTEVKALINGVNAFGELEKALKHAKKTVDIICWGFDPSFRLGGHHVVRADGVPPRFGDILEEIATRPDNPVTVRVLIWYSVAADMLPAFPDKSLPDLLEAPEALSFYQEKNHVMFASHLKSQYEQTKANYEWLIESLNAKVTGNQKAEILAIQDQIAQAKTKMLAAEEAYLKVSYDARVNKMSETYRQMSEEVRQASMMYGNLPTIENKKAFEKVYQTYLGARDAFHADYNRAYVKASGNPIDKRISDQAYNHQWYKRAIGGQIDNLYFSTRDMKNFPSIFEALNQTIQNNRDENGQPILTNRDMVLILGASHHQKMALIDYELPDEAIGFVMGHNMQKNYYDDHQHQFYSQTRYPGFMPWQDISFRVRGEVLYDLNHNFTTAWDTDGYLRDKGMDSLRQWFLFNDFKDTLTEEEKALFSTWLSSSQIDDELLLDIIAQNVSLGYNKTLDKVEEIKVKLKAHWDLDVFKEIDEYFDKFWRENTWAETKKRLSTELDKLTDKFTDYILKSLDLNEITVNTVHRNMERKLLEETRSEFKSSYYYRADFKPHRIDKDNGLGEYGSHLMQVPEAQIWRTQPVDKDFSILAGYTNALNNTMQLIYMENQYFRYPDFAKQITALGKKRAEKNLAPLYWFVVTNKPNSPGEVGTTKEMLETIGYEDRLPEVIRTEKMHSQQDHIKIKWLNMQRAVYQEMKRTTLALATTLNQERVDKLITIIKNDPFNHAIEYLRNSAHRFNQMITSQSVKLHNHVAQFLEDMHYDPLTEVSEDWQAVWDQAKTQIPKEIHIPTLEAGYQKRHDEIESVVNEIYRAKQALEDKINRRHREAKRTATDNPQLQLTIEAIRANHLTIEQLGAEIIKLKDQLTTLLARFCDEYIAEAEDELDYFDMIYPRPKTEIDEEDATKVLSFNDPEGIKMVLAKLTTSTDHRGANNRRTNDNLYSDIYVHSKLLVVDDVFCVLGSANINLRSMKVDSELAIAIPHAQFPKAVREELWRNHTGFFYSNLEDEYQEWIKLMNDNWRDIHFGKPLRSNITHFYDPDTPTGVSLD